MCIRDSQYSDYPSADTYSYLNGDLSYNNYYEGIYVGYRWFDATKKRVRYPFGFGLSYTDFSYAVEKVEADGSVVTVTVAVTNVGDTYGGKEVLQLYLAKPNARLDHEENEMCIRDRCKSRLSYIIVIQTTTT